MTDLMKDGLERKGGWWALSVTKRQRIEKKAQEGWNKERENYCKNKKKRRSETKGRKQESL